jgi:hypothetical protein
MSMKNKFEKKLNEIKDPTIQSSIKTGNETCPRAHYLVA